MAYGSGLSRQGSERACFAYQRSKLVENGSYFRVINPIIQVRETTGRASAIKDQAKDGSAKDDEGWIDLGEGQ
jgi:hypothetical protein